MQIYEVFRRKPIKEAVAAPVRKAVPAKSPVGAVPNPSAQKMPGGMATSAKQTGTMAPPSQMPNAAYGQISSNVPQMQRSGSRAVATTTQPAARQSSAVPATVPAGQRANVDDVLDAPKPTTAGRLPPAQPTTIDVPSRTVSSALATTGQPQSRTAASAAVPATVAGQGARQQVAPGPDDIIDAPAKPALSAQSKPQVTIDDPAAQAAQRRQSRQAAATQAAQGQMADFSPLDPAAQAAQRRQGRLDTATQVAQDQMADFSPLDPAAQAAQRRQSRQALATQVARDQMDQQGEKSKSDKKTKPKDPSPEILKKNSPHKLGSPWLMAATNYLAKKMGGPEVWTQKEIEQYKDFKSMPPGDFLAFYGMNKNQWAQRYAYKLPPEDIPKSVTGKLGNKWQSSAPPTPPAPPPPRRTKSATKSRPQPTRTIEPNPTRKMRRTEPGLSSQAEQDKFDELVRQAIAAQGKKKK